MSNSPELLMPYRKRWGKLRKAAAKKSPIHACSDSSHLILKKKKKTCVTIYALSNSHGATWVRNRILGKGTFAYVFLAKSLTPDPQNPHRLPPEIAVKSATLDKSSWLRFERQILAKFPKSPHIVNCHGDEITETESGEKIYNILLEYCPGHSLDDRIKKSGCKGLPESEIVCYTRDIVRGLCVIHDSGYIHCDIKPDNILLSPFVFGRLMAKIADIGLVETMKGDDDDDDDEEEDGEEGISYEVRGTYGYMSPEVVMYGKLSWAVDIWALGCVVLKMMTGKSAWGFVPHSFEDFRNLYYYTNMTPEIPDDISVNAEDFLSKCLVREPKCRWKAMQLLEHPFIC